MPYILSVGTYSPPYYLSQDDVKPFVRELFSDRYKDIDRLLNVFHNGQIEGRYFSAPLEWFQTDHTFAEKNDLYTKLAVTFGIEAIKNTLETLEFLHHPVPYQSIDAIFFISTSGIATPSIEAKIMNQLPFSVHTKRIPIWGLGCAGGAAGIARANEYCRAYPEANVLVLSVELCSLTFQRGDLSKSNLVGASLFADGIACSLICGDESDLLMETKHRSLPYICDNRSTLMPDSEDVMGWQVKNSGLHVVFSKAIPRIIERWLRTEIEQFLHAHSLLITDIDHFVCHPGGKKVLEAYSHTLNINLEKMAAAFHVLKNYGNMSSATVLYVLKQYMQLDIPEHDNGILTALGPGFSSELLLLKWHSAVKVRKEKEKHVV